MVLEYASSYQTRPVIIYGSPGGGKSLRAFVLSLMMGLPISRTDIPLSTNTGGLSGAEGIYQNASPGLIVGGMIRTNSCNYVFNGEELDKEAHSDRFPCFSEQFLKLTDQDAKRFVDNRLGFEIDASHIVYIFTANEKANISPPMLDRCEVIELPPPNRMDMETIVRGAVIPKTIGKVRANSEITFSEEAIDFIIQSLWKGDNTSVRQYQSLISKCVNAANYTCICEERPVVIQVSDAQTQLKKMSSLITPKNRIGFA